LNGSFETIRCEVDGVHRLGRITLDRPQLRNPLDRLGSGEVLVAFEQLLADDAVRSIVIAANGPAFCAGGDLRQMRQFGEMSGEEALEWPASIVDLHQRMLVADKPVIAAVDGPAFAGGMGLAGMCDVIVATPQAQFAMPEVKIGLFPMIIVAHLVRSMPRKKLLEMMLTGDPIDAEEAYRLGFVNRVVPDAEALEAAVQQYAQRFAAVSSSAVRLGRRAFTLMADMPAHQALDAAQFFNVALFHGNDLREGAEAFLEKRPPRWAEPDA
jgi:enoyl-CoA hydratase/carnithine racemase